MSHVMIKFIRLAVGTNRGNFRMTKLLTALFAWVDDVKPDSPSVFLQ